MPTQIQCPNLPLESREVEALWQKTIAYQQYPDELVVVKCVSEEEIQLLNSTYRQKNKPTNVLTFSYGKAEVPGQEAEHDVALCLSIAQREAQERNMAFADYIALLLVHAFLHASGMDHEASTEAAEAQQQAEQAIMKEAGFAMSHL